MFESLQNINKSKTSFYSILLAIFLGLIFIFSDLLERPLSQFIELITSILIFFFISLSFIVGIKSLKINESYKWMAVTAVILSSIYILFLVLAFLFILTWAFL